MYIAEISPASMRGKFVSLNQLTIVIGILAAQLVNWQIADPVPTGATEAEILESWNGQMGWRWMFWAEIIPAGLFFILMFLVPESPRWQAKIVCGTHKPLKFGQKAPNTLQNRPSAMPLRYNGQLQPGGDLDSTTDTNPSGACRDGSESR